MFGYLKKLRQSRKGLVESLDQYKFVYDTLEEFVVCGNSWFPVSELSARLKQKSVRNPATRLNEYQREYQVRDAALPRGGGYSYLELSIGNRQVQVGGATLELCAIALRPMPSCGKDCDVMYILCIKIALI